PGGKSTAVARTGATVFAGDVDEVRASLIATNRDRVRPDGAVRVFAGDGRRPPFAPEGFDRVLLDAPCTGLGTLRRRPDARWRIEPGDVERLAVLQRQLLEGADECLGPGGTLVYSVCTMTNAETVAIDRWLADRHPELVAV